MTDSNTGFTRRSLIGVAAGAGVIGAGAIAAGLGAPAFGRQPAATVPAEAAGRLGSSTLPFYGPHQAGISTAPQAHSTLLALHLHDDTDRAAVRRMMRILTDDAARMTRGETALADMEAELAAIPANLTVTFGFGPGLVARVGGTGPDWLAPLPAFGIDRLDPRWTGGDLVIRVASDDPMTVAHVSRMLLKDTRSFARPHWAQPGFRRAAGSTQHGATMRNLFGQVDGTVNPVPDTAVFDSLVWSADGWVAGGTSMVVRRIRMDLDAWDRLDRSGREQAIGRTLSNGAPLTGVHETDEPDFDAAHPNGFTVIPDFAHMRRARGDGPAPQILRQPYNYEHGPTEGSVSDAGLVFVSYQANPVEQFVPMQRRLDELDLLNQWTTPIGSAVFAIPPGCAEGGYIGETLLD